MRTLAMPGLGVFTAWMYVLYIKLAALHSTLIK